MGPAFLFVVDTEGDSEWTVHRRMPPVRNVHALPRFQALCDRYGVKPTYVVTHSIAADDTAVAMLREWVSAGRAEVGTHLHPWTTPPFASPWDDAGAFPSELPDDLLAAKFRTLTDYITARFGRAPTSYRAGRFGFDTRTLGHLESLGYVIDSSVTPLKSWAQYPGAPGGKGGPDFTRAPLAPYRLHREDVTRAGDSPVWELPLTILDDDRTPAALHGRLGALPDAHLAARVLAKLKLRRRLWLRPTLESAPEMLDACTAAMARGVPWFNMMIHSSELFPNTSPYFESTADIDALFDRMDGAFERIFRRYNPAPCTLTDAAARLSAHSPA